jgi:O-antigen/teichoic acid export membrane protein
MILANFRKIRAYGSEAVIIGSLSTLAIKIASAGLVYVMFVLISRAMTVLEFGKFSIGFNTASFLAVIASCGAHVGINRWWPEYVAKGAPGIAKAAFFWGLKVTTIASVALALVAATVGIVMRAYAVSVDMYLFAALAMITPVALAEYLANAMRAQGSLWWAQIPKDIIWRLVACALAVLAAARSWRFGADVALWMLTGSLAILILAQSFAAARVARAIGSQTSAQVGQLATERSNWLKMLLPLWGGAVLNAVVQNVDVLLVGAFVSVEKSGEYFAAVRTTNLLGLMHVAATLVCAPMISSQIYGNKIDELQANLRSVCMLVGSCTLAILVALIVAGPILLGLFDAAFRDGYPILLVLSVGFAFNALCGPVGYLLMLTGYERHYLRILLVSYGISFAVQLILIPMIGSIGAAIGSTIALVMVGLWSRHVAIQKVGVDPTALCIFISRRAVEN